MDTLILSVDMRPSNLRALNSRPCVGLDMYCASAVAWKLSAGEERHTRRGELESRLVMATLVAEGEKSITLDWIVTALATLMVMPLNAAPMMAGTPTSLTRCFASSTA